MSERDRKALEYPFDKYPDKDSSWRSVQDAVVKLKAHITQLEAENNAVKESNVKMLQEIDRLEAERDELRKGNNNLREGIDEVLATRTRMEPVIEAARFEKKIHESVMPGEKADCQSLMRMNNNVLQYGYSRS